MGNFHKFDKMIVYGNNEFMFDPRTLDGNNIS